MLTQNFQTFIDTLLDTELASLDGKLNRLHYLKNELNYGKGLTFASYEVEGTQVHRINYKKSSEFSTMLVEDIKRAITDINEVSLGQGIVFKVENKKKSLGGELTYIYVSSGSIAVSFSNEAYSNSQLKKIFGVDLPVESVAEKASAEIKKNGWKPQLISYSAFNDRQGKMFLNSTEYGVMKKVLTGLIMKHGEEKNTEEAKKHVETCAQSLVKLTLETDEMWTGVKSFKLNSNDMDIRLETSGGRIKNKNVIKFMELFKGSAPVLSSDNSFLTYSLSIDGKKFGSALQGLTELVNHDLDCPPLKQYADKLKVGFMFQDLVKPLQGITLGAKGFSKDWTPTLTMGLPLAKERTGLIAMLNNVLGNAGAQLPKEGKTAHFNLGEMNLHLAQTSKGVVGSNQEFRSTDFAYLKSALNIVFEVNQDIVDYHKEKNENGNHGTIYDLMPKLLGLKLDYNLKLGDEGNYIMELKVSQ